jgi:hypothetical protein
MFIYNTEHKKATYESEILQDENWKLWVAMQITDTA